MSGYPNFEPVQSSNLEWMSRANCAPNNDEEAEKFHSMFFVDAGRTISAEALDLCRTCPVRQECINHAYTGGPDGTMIPAGYFGGLSLGQRKSMSLVDALDFAAKDTEKALTERDNTETGPATKQ